MGHTARVTTLAGQSSRPLSRLSTASLVEMRARVQAEVLETAKAIRRRDAVEELELLTGLLGRLDRLLERRADDDDPAVVRLRRERVEARQAAQIKPRSKSRTSGANPAGRRRAATA